MRTTLLVSLIFSVLLLSAQKKKAEQTKPVAEVPAVQPTQPEKPAVSAMDSIPVELAKKIFIYQASIQYNDPVVTRMALYSLLAENPNNISLRDSLALLYFEQQQYASAALVAQEVVAAVPDNMFATEIAAISFERLGVKNRAIKFYEKLYLDNSNDLNTLYKMAFIQNDLKLYEESMNSAQRLMEHADAKSLMLIFPTDDGKGQEISMEIAAIRLKGMIEEQRNNTVEAKEYFSEVLKKAPNFEIVKKQLAGLGK